MFFLGKGDELNRVYIAYDELDDFNGGFAPLVERGVSVVILRRPPIPPPPALRAVFDRAASEGTLLTTISPFLDGVDAEDETPYLDNEDWAPSAGLSHKGPLIEIWSLEESLP